MSLLKVSTLKGGGLMNKQTDKHRQADSQVETNNKELILKSACLSRQYKKKVHLGSSHIHEHGKVSEVVTLTGGVLFCRLQHPATIC